MVAFDYKYLPISDLQVETTEDQKTGKQKVKSVLVHDEPLQATDRFWVSLFARYGFNRAFFRYFDHAEVFDRISNKESQDRMRVCIERDDKTGNKLLGVSNPTKPIVPHNELIELLNRYEGEGISYANGIVESTHRPRVGNNFDVAGDMFSHRFVMSTPIDGYGQPNLYLSLLRLICTNGMIGYSRAFRSTLALGKGNDDVSHNITRALDGFNNDEGFAVMRQRMEAATTSWASVYETTSLYKLLTKLHHGRQLNVDDPTLKDAPVARGYLSDGGIGTDDPVGSPLIKSFHGMTGDTSRLYGLANLLAEHQASANAAGAVHGVRRSQLRDGSGDALREARGVAAAERVGRRVDQQRVRHGRDQGQVRRFRRFPHHAEDHGAGTDRLEWR